MVLTLEPEAAAVVSFSVIRKYANAMAEPLPVHPLTVHDYHAMAEAGILNEDSRVELIDGQIIEKVTLGPKHVRVVNRLTEIAVKRASDVVEVSIQNPVRLGLYTEPEPDVVLLRKDRDIAQVPHAEDVLLLIEVADASLRVDRHLKLPRYAAAEIPEVWIVNIPDERIECYRRPSPTGYATATILGVNEEAAAALVPELGPIPIRTIFDS